MTDAEYAKKKERVALITGITGQDGSYLAEYLLAHTDYSYEVHGIIRRSSSFNTGRIDHIYKDLHEHPRLILHYGDLTDSTNLMSIISRVEPDEIYNLAAQSHVKVSFEMPEYTADVDAVGALRLLDAVRSCKLEKKCRFYQASTSELYGGVSPKALSETTPFYPRSPYAVAKQFAYWSVVNYREAYGIFACNGILFNHESPRRGRTFVTRKITRAVADIKCENQEVLYLGNINAKRDWGHARDYVQGMWMMLQRETPVDYVLATGETWTVRYFVERAFKEIDLTITWSGEAENEIGTDQHGVVRVRIDPVYYRPSEVETLLGDASKAEKELGWRRQVSFEDLVKDMVQHDLQSVRARKYGIERAATPTSNNS